MAVISVKNLKKHYQVSKKRPGLAGSLRALFRPQVEQVKAVDGVSFSLSSGELVGFIGPNGAGKTTTLKVLSGLLYPTSGRVEVLGFNPWDRKPEFQKQFALVMGQKNQLWWNLPPTETFLLNKEIYEIPDRDYKKNLDELVYLLDVAAILDTPSRKLSLGQRMKCELIASLIHKPKILFLDEPTIGLDVVMQKRIRDFVRDYNRRHGSTIILTSHNMDDVAKLAKRIIMIDRGKIVFDGSLSEIVEKYAPDKILSVIFANSIDPKKLVVVGELKNFDFPKAVFSVPREKTAAAAAKLLQIFPVVDLNIEEPAIEDIIGRVFVGFDEQAKS